MTLHLLLLGAVMGTSVPAAACPTTCQYEAEGPLGLFPPEVYETDPVGEGQIRVQTPDGLGALVLEHTSVVAEIHAGLARVTMIQWFNNPYEVPLEAEYLLPLPSGAAVDRMDLTCGDRVIEGVIMERQAARAAYEDARNEGVKAALLEQERDNLFTQSLANLCPGEEVQVTIQWVEQVGYADGQYSWSMPMTVGERYSPPWVGDHDRLTTEYTRTGRTIDVAVYLDEGTPVGGLWSETHDIDVVEETEWGAAIELDNEGEIPNRDFSLGWTLAGDQPRAAALTHRPRADEPGTIAVTLEPQVLGDLFVPRPRELMFVIDGSCSMRGTPYEIATETVRRALQEMNETDTFNLVKFADGATSLFDQPQPANAQTRAKAEAWLAHFSGGGTNMDQGIVHSLTVPGNPKAMRLVLMLTDGFIGGEDHMFATVRAHLGEARLFSLGVGAAPNRFLLEGLAEMGRGDVIYQRAGSPVSHSVDRFYDRIAHPAMSHIEIDWGGLAITEQFPSRIPDLWAGQPVRVVAKYTEGSLSAEAHGQLHTTVRVTGLVGADAFAVDLPLALPAVSHAHEGVAKLWARRKIRDLEWYPRGRSALETRAAIVDVALSHHLMSKYTSLVAIDDRPSGCGGAALQVEVPHEAVAKTVAESAGVLGALGQQVGSGGLGSRGSGLGGGGTTHRLYGMGSKGRGSGSSGYGSGGGDFGASGRAGGAAIGGEPIILGGLDRSVIDAVIKRNLNRIRYCYQRELAKDPNLAGKVVLKFILGPDGTVQKAEVDSSNLGNTRVEDCISKTFMRMRFPAASGGGIVIVRYPFVFSAGT